MLLTILLVILGLLLLVAGGETLLRGAVGLATILRITPAVVGLTIVAAGTSVPELAVSGAAAWQGKVDIAVANVVGSNIFNIAFILGLCALVRPLAILGNTIRLEYPVLALVTLLSIAVSEEGVISRLDGALFLAIYGCFTIYVVRLVRRQMTEAEKVELQAEVKELDPTPARPPNLWACSALIVLGVFLLVGGAHATVTGAVQLAQILGLSERVIGLTIVAGGTGLPEVVTSLVSSFRGRDDIAIGNVIGSNLFNILVILGLGAALSPLPVAEGILRSDNWWMLGITLLLFPLMYTGLRINRWEGALLLAVYGAYLCWLLG